MDATYRGSKPPARAKKSALASAHVQNDARSMDAYPG